MLRSSAGLCRLTAGERTACICSHLGLRFSTACRFSFKAAMVTARRIGTLAPHRQVFGRRVLFGTNVYFFASPLTDRCATVLEDSRVRHDARYAGVAGWRTFAIPPTSAAGGSGSAQRDLSLRSIHSMPARRARSTAADSESKLSRSMKRCDRVRSPANKVMTTRA